jgi:hypothetical protein
MRGIIAPIFFVGILSLFSPTGYSCVCLVPDVSRAVERADAVFVGEVVDIVEPSTSDLMAPLLERSFIIKFKVQKSWKGVTSDEVDVLSGQSKYNCFAFPPVNKGEKYLVYAEKARQDKTDQKRWLTIDICNRTAQVPEPGTHFDVSLGPRGINRKDASEDLKELERMPNPSSDFRSPSKN